MTREIVCYYRVMILIVLPNSGKISVFLTFDLGLPVFIFLLERMDVSGLSRILLCGDSLLISKDTGLARDSMVLCENPQCIPKDELGKYITTLSDSYMAQVAAASILASGAISYMDLEMVVRLWQQANNLNQAS